MSQLSNSRTCIAEAVAHTAHPHSQVCVLEGKAYAELDPGTETEEDLEQCMLLTNSQGKELLAPGKGAEQADNKKILLKLQDGQVCAAISAVAPA